MRAPDQALEEGGRVPERGVPEMSAPEGGAPEVSAPEGGALEVGDVAVVATKGRLVDRSCLVVEVEVSVPAAFSLARWALVTESVQAAVLSVIGKPEPASPQPTRAAIPLSWLSVSSGTGTSTTAAALPGGRA